MAAFASKQELVAILEKMIANLNEDEKFASRIAKADISIGCKLTDLDAQYTFVISDGKLTGKPHGADAATIGVSCTSDTFDKLLSARLSGESAYMSGAIRLRGNEWTAQSAASYLYYFAPAYKAAKGDS